MKNLTNQQKKFVKEYIKHLDSEAALKHAGYKTKDIQDFSQNLLSRPEIVNEIKRQLDKQIKALKVERGYVVQKLLQIAEFSLEEEDILDKDGNLTGKRKLRDTTAGLKALDALCKYIGFTSKNNEEGLKDAKIITISNLDDSKI